MAYLHKATFICNKIIHLKASLQFIFILQLTTINNIVTTGGTTTGKTTTLLEVTNPSHHNNSMNSPFIPPMSIFKFLKGCKTSSHGRIRACP